MVRRWQPPPVITEAEVEAKRKPELPQGMTEEQFTAWLEKSCEESGVPVRVTDPETIHKIARLMRG